jgi:hypothetical protein
VNKSVYIFINLISLPFFFIYSNIKVFFERIFFIFRKKNIHIPLTHIFKLSSITIFNLNKANSKNYEVDVQNFLENNITKKKYFFDIGAHYGFYTFQFCKKFDKIYSFEANPENFKILNFNIKKKNILNVQTINEFVSDSDNTVDFLMSYNTYLSQYDKKSFLYEELLEFCKDGFHYKNNHEFEEILKRCYGNLIVQKFNLNYFLLLLNLFKNISNLKNEDFKIKMNIFKRYLKFHERYKCKKIKVTSFNFDNRFNGNFRDSFVKIDVEGSELIVLKGMNKFIRSNQPEVFCEIGDNHDKIIDYFFNLGYSHQKIDWKSYYFSKNKKI